MKRILLVSDNHSLNNLDEAINNGGFDYKIHLGDSVMDFSSKTMENFDYKIKGNCDYDPKYSLEITEHLHGVGKVFMLHGHTRNVKYSLNEVKDYCYENKINICFYGHTHMLHIQYEKENDLLIINPGSMEHSRGNIPKTTYVILEVFANTYEISVMDAQLNKKIYETQKINRNITC